MKVALASYFFMCAAVGAAMGSRGYPIFWDFFYPPLWYLSIALAAIGFVLLEISRRLA